MGKHIRGSFRYWIGSTWSENPNLASATLTPVLGLFVAAFRTLFRQANLGGSCHPVMRDGPSFRVAGRDARSLTPPLMNNTRAATSSGTHDSLLMYTGTNGLKRTAVATKPTIQPVRFCPPATIADHTKALARKPAPCCAVKLQQQSSASWHSVDEGGVPCSLPTGGKRGRLPPPRRSAARYCLFSPRRRQPDPGRSPSSSTL
jgi:hypothetical protein